MSRFIHAFVQVIALIVIRVIYGLFVRRTVHPSLEKLDPNKKTIVVANHRKAIDPFLICIFLPLNEFLKLLPFCYIVYRRFYYSPLRPLLWLTGCFPTKNPKKESNIAGIEGAIRLIKRGYTLVIFPEGTRVKDEPVRIRTGVEVIAGQLDEPVQFITVHVTYKLSKIHLAYGLVEEPGITAAELIDEVYKL
jgi:1-acyl-sn-glycerol-3-phosphate acyltransferase